MVRLFLLFTRKMGRAAWIPLAGKSFSSTAPRQDLGAGGWREIRCGVENPLVVTPIRVPYLGSQMGSTIGSHNEGLIPNSRSAR